MGAHGLPRLDGRRATRHTVATVGARDGDERWTCRCDLPWGGGHAYRAFPLPGACWSARKREPLSIIQAVSSAWIADLWASTAGIRVKKWIWITGHGCQQPPCVPKQIPRRLRGCPAIVRQERPQLNVRCLKQETTKCIVMLFSPHHKAAPQRPQLEKRLGDTAEPPDSRGTHAGQHAEVGT